MVSIVTNNFRHKNAEEFIESFTESPETNYYAFIGRSSAWPDDNAPPVPTFSDDDIEDSWNALLAMKKIGAANVAKVTRRIDWVSGTVYTQYDSSDANLFLKDFYVLTDDFNVYKCINNNSGGTSTVKPSGNSISEIITGDGYTWKYMYTISGSDILNFLLDDWMPVRNDATVTAAANASSTTPYFGHGYNAEYELFAHYVEVSVKLTDTEGGDFPIDITYRQVGLVRDPLEDDGTTTLVDATAAPSEIQLGSGRIMSLSNRAPILRSANQSETLKLIMSF